ncbi:MAG TPA: BolA/IbaG family iron-sulfur metabolism protein [Gammaproteobacteria bacterium]|nr:BolA/IbaG family iron-sulfur metabolism protein [Gammaproteobacteria bacterium]
MRAEDIKQLIEKSITDAEVTVTGEGDHFEATVVSALFEGKTMVQQHQMVYGALGQHMHSDIHALALHTYTPEKWASSSRIQ